jgi:hypothetical protein
MATVIRKERALPDSLANAPNRPFAAFEDRPYERAGRATKRSSADGVGCAGSDPRRSELRRQVNAKRGFARLRPGRLSVLLALTICRDPKKTKMNYDEPKLRGLTIRPRAFVPETNGKNCFLHTSVKDMRRISCRPVREPFHLLSRAGPIS